MLDRHYQYITNREVPYVVDGYIWLIKILICYRILIGGEHGTWDFAIGFGNIERGCEKGPTSSFDVVHHFYYHADWLSRFSWVVAVFQNSTTGHQCLTDRHLRRQCLLSCLMASTKRVIHDSTQMEDSHEFPVRVEFSFYSYFVHNFDSFYFSYWV